MKWGHILLLLLLIQPVSAAWYNDSWSNRIAVVVNSSEVDADLTDFPVYVDLNNLPTSFWDTVKSDGGDIRITKSDETTEVAREIVFIDTGTANAGELHFKAAGTLSSSSNGTFYVYYGNAAASDYATSATYGAENVWDSNYEGVWHLQEAVNTSAGGYAESTSNSRDATGISMALTEVDGQLSGKGQDFDGTADYINLTDFDVGTAFSASLWINRDVEGGTNLIADRGTVAGHQFNYLFGGSGGNDANRLFVQNTGHNGASDAMSTGTWYLRGFSFDAGTNVIEYYGDGANYASGTNTGTPSYNSSYDFTLMTQILSGSPNNLTNGKVDEVRISSVVRSDAWFAAEYTNQSTPSTFYTVGTEESAPSEAVNNIFMWNVF